jgi:hypothetical protein
MNIKNPDAKNRKVKQHGEYKPGKSPEMNASLP